MSPVAVMTAPASAAPVQTNVNDDVGHVFSVVVVVAALSAAALSAAAVLSVILLILSILFAAYLVVKQLGILQH